jgi:hypothetical protein
VRMENTELLNLLKSAIEKFNIDVVVLVDVNKGIAETLNQDALEDFRGLYNSLFFACATVQASYENLRVSILPQMVRQGDKYCYVGLLNNHYIYGAFGRTDKSVMEQYYLSKEIDEFLHSP